MMLASIVGRLFLSALCRKAEVTHGITVSLCLSSFCSFWARRHSFAQGFAVSAFFFSLSVLLERLLLPL
jgi:hypothetical protein